MPPFLIQLVEQYVFNYFVHCICLLVLLKSLSWQLPMLSLRALSYYLLHFIPPCNVLLQCIWMLIWIGVVMKEAICIQPAIPPEPPFLFDCILKPYLVLFHFVNLYLLLLSLSTVYPNCLNKSKYLYTVLSLTPKYLAMV